MTNLTLALDAMGGDHGPHVTVPAALQALKSNSSIQIILIGNQADIEPLLLSAEPSILKRIEGIHGHFRRNAGL